MSQNSKPGFTNKKMNNKKRKCWDFVMSSFARSYGVKKIMTEDKFHEIAISWWGDNKMEKCKTLEEYDRYFKELYENWK